MSLSLGEFVLPRPGEAPSSPKPPIPAPGEAAFRETFGKLLPSAKYVHTVNGKGAYYELLPSSVLSTENSSHVPHRVLFLHGIQTPALGMLPLVRAVQAVSPQSHLVLVDLWGHGLSDTPVAPHDQNLFHQLVDALLNQLGWPSVHLVGFSFGGSLVVAYAASRPSKVQSFIPIAPVGLVESSSFTAEQQAHLRGGDEVAAREWVLEYLEGGELVVPADWK